MRVKWKKGGNWIDLFGSQIDDLIQVRMLLLVNLMAVDAAVIIYSGVSILILM
jgi:phage-related minor tail protein